MPDKPEKSSNILRYITAAGGLAGSVGAIIGAWMLISNHITDTSAAAKEEVIKEIQSTAILLTNELNSKDYKIVESLRDAINMHIQIRKLEITRLQADGETIPERYMMEQQTFEEMLKELDRRWETD